MDFERIKQIYDERFKGNPGAMEEYVIERLQQEFADAILRPDKARKDVFAKGGTKVIFEKDSEGHIIDMRFEIG